MRLLMVSSVLATSANHLVKSPSLPQQVGLERHGISFEALMPSTKALVSASTFSPPVFPATSCILAFEEQILEKSLYFGGTDGTHRFPQNINGLPQFGQLTEFRVNLTLQDVNRAHERRQIVIDGVHSFLRSRLFFRIRRYLLNLVEFLVGFTTGGNEFVQILRS